MSADESVCRHCGERIRRETFTNATGDPYMWVHARGRRPKCMPAGPGDPYAEPKEQQ